MNQNYNENSSLQLNSFKYSYDQYIKYVQVMIENNLITKSGDEESKPLIILDIGCSHGRNSIIQINPIVEMIHSQDPYKEVHVYHSDIESNDFSLLFKELRSNPYSYFKKGNGKNVFSFAIGKGLEHRLMPNSSVDLIFSFFTFNWTENFIPKFQSNDHSFVISRESSMIYPEYSEYCKNHLKSNYLKRLEELKKGGILICHFPILDSNNIEISLEDVMGEFKSILKTMVNENYEMLSIQEVNNIIVPFALNSEVECYEIANLVSHDGLKLIHSEVKVIHSSDVIQNNDAPMKTVLSLCENFIKLQINGDETRKKSIFNEFEKRLKIYQSLNPHKFQFSLTVIYNYFQKTK